MLHFMVKPSFYLSDFVKWRIIKTKLIIVEAQINIFKNDYSHDNILAVQTWNKEFNKIKTIGKILSKMALESNDHPAVDTIKQTVTLKYFKSHNIFKNANYCQLI